MPSQQLAVPHLVANPVAALFAGMGVGKTGAVLAALDELFCDGAIRGALVVAPLRVALLTWPQEVERWDEFRYMRVADLRTDEGRAAWKGGTAHVYCINYESLPKFIDECVVPLNGSWMPADVVVWDELSKAKNPSGKRVNKFRKLARDKFSRHWGLTGTPVPNSHLDLFAQIRLLDGGQRLGTAFYRYRNAYFYPEHGGLYPKYLLHDRGKKEIEEKIADITLTLRSEDYLDIPPVGVEDVEVDLPPAARATYRELEKELLVMLEEGELVALNAAALATKLLQITGGSVYTGEEKSVSYLHSAKVHALEALHEREGCAPMIVACAYRHEMERICSLVQGAEMFETDRVAAWNRGEIPLLVMHPRSGGHGLNLQAGGSRVVWMTPTYSREEYDQLNARVARTGQADPVKIFRVLCPGTIDDAVVEALRTKGDNQDSLMAALKNLQRLRQ
jgi:SNF2 family DNA or RNA helicase